MKDIDKNELWHDCLETIKISVSPAIFSTWFSQTFLVSCQKILERCSVEVGCPSLFVKNTIEGRYYGLIQDALSKNINLPCNLTFLVKQNPDKTHAEGNVSPLFEKQGETEGLIAECVKASRLRPYFTFENFAVSSSNQMAWAAGEAVLENPGSAYNPLFLWGGVGVGKTHLMNAVGYEILKKDNDKKIYLCTGEDFTNDIVEGIRSKSTQSFRNKYRKLDVLLIDDIQFIAGKDAVQEEFFHTFNAIISAGGQIILTSDKPPSDIAKLEERLRSRFEAGLIVDISPADFELRCAIIQIKAKEKGLNLAMDLVQLIAGNVDTARKIEGVLIRVLTEIRVHKLNIVTEEVIKQALGKKSQEEKDNRRITSNEITDIVCKHFSIKKRDLFGQSRIKNFVYPRQILMYLIRTLIGMPLQEVGRSIGDRDHTTVMHAVEKITKLASIDVQTREDIQRIKNSL